MLYYTTTESISANAKNYHDSDTVPVVHVLLLVVTVLALEVARLGVLGGSLKDPAVWVFLVITS